MEYPTLFTAGTRWLAPQPRHASGGRDGPRSRPSVLVRHRRDQRVRGRVDGRRAQHVLDRARHRAGVRTELSRRCGTSAASCRGCFTDFALSREMDGNRLAGTGATHGSDVQATPTFRYWPASPAAITYNKTALWLHTLERYLGWPVLQRILSTYFARYAFQHPRPQDFFDVANEVSGRDLTWYFDQVYRGSADVRLRGRFLPQRSRAEPISHRGGRPPVRRRRVSRHRPGDGCRRHSRRTGRGTGAIAGRCSRSTARSRP